MIRALLLGAFFLSLAAAGFLTGSNWLNRPHPVEGAAWVRGIAPEAERPVVQAKPVVVVVTAHNAAAWCERSLRSIFEQNYERYRVFFIDDGSTDGTFEIAQQYIVDNQQDERVIALRHETAVGPVGCLVRAAEYCQGPEIVVPLDARNWLAHEGVLARLNQVFQNPDVWVAFGQSILYPEYRLVFPPVFEAKEVEKRGYGTCACSALAFYASLFQAIRLPDLFGKGVYSRRQEAYLKPLLEQAGGRFRSLSEPLAFSNAAEPLRKEQEELPKARRYAALAQLPSVTVGSGAVDLLVFSYDRPMQLYAFLESVHRYATGRYSLSVLYRVSDARYEAAYQRVKADFPKVRYIKQSDNPRKDFKPLLLQAVFDSPADYILFAVDDIILKDSVDLDFCRAELERTGAYGFYLRFGRHICHSYMHHKPIALPPKLPLRSGLYVWDTSVGEIDWGFPNCLDMTLYRKADIKRDFTEMKYKTPNSLESAWSSRRPANSIGLYFEQSKIVNVPLNIVNPSDCAHMNYMTAEELLLKFDQGLKMDIDPLYRVENSSPHFESIPEFVLR